MPEDRDEYKIIRKLIEAELKNFTAQIQVQDGFVVLIQDIKVSDQQKIKR